MKRYEMRQNEKIEITNRVAHSIDWLKVKMRINQVGVDSHLIDDSKLNCGAHVELCWMWNGIRSSGVDPVNNEIDIARWE